MTYVLYFISPNLVTMGKAEDSRLKKTYSEEENWLHWGPYLSERQWGTVREDYSADGSAWDYFPHDHARSRTYRWGEDGIAGICDRHCAIAFAVTLWNGKDPILKERLFGLTGPEGNHAEDCKELYYYLDSSPTHSYMKHLYKYPQNEYPYADLIHTNKARGKADLEYELLDTGVFNNDEYFDVYTEYAKENEEDVLIKITVHNRASEAADIWVLPTLWLRNLWSFNQAEGYHNIEKHSGAKDFGTVKLTHPKLGDYYLNFQNPDKWLFTNNETNTEKLFGVPNESPYVKDLFHDVVIQDNFELTDAVEEGTKFAPMYKLHIAANGSQEIRLRLSKQQFSKNPLLKKFTETFAQRIQETDEFYSQFHNGNADLQNIQRQAFAGMLWTKQYYNLDVNTWLNGDPGKIPPPESRKHGRNHEWKTLNNEDIITMPDKWEYPWYAVWDTAFHCVPLAKLDAEFAKQQLLLVTKEWYMAPNGQIPAYEWAFSDVNPPVQAWATIQVFEIDKAKTGVPDIDFLKRMLNKLGLNFTWWVNRKDRNNNNVFEGGFLGLDNIGLFDRSSVIPGGGFLEQADGTAWMAMYSLNLLQISLEIAQHDSAYEDMATKYLEHFIYIAESLNTLGCNWTGSWNEEEGFFYDLLVLPNHTHIPIKVRSLVGLMTLNANLVINKEIMAKLPNFTKNLKWFLNYRSKNNAYQVVEHFKEDEDLLLSLVPKNRMVRLLKALTDINEFFSEYGIRGMSKIHTEPYRVYVDGQEFSVGYEPAESSNYVFGGNSNWRGPIWMPMNYLFIQTLKEYYTYYKDDIKVEVAGELLNLKQLAHVISKRVISMFENDNTGQRPIHALDKEIYGKPHFKDLVLFYEYFHGDTGRGIGATHQTGWTGVVASMIDECAKFKE